MNFDLFPPRPDDRDARINRLGDPLQLLSDEIDWESFRPLLMKVHEQRQRKSNAGRKPRDVVVLFKGLVLKQLYDLSDDQLEYQLEDRRSFQRFVGLKASERAPDAKTFWDFQNQLSELKLTGQLFTRFSQQLQSAGYLARGGQMIDASIVKAPVQHNRREENDQIKQGEVPEDWSEEKQRQKDTDARWTKKNNRSFFGYKNHINADRKHKLIRKYVVTPANTGDSLVFDELLDEGNTSKDCWADAAYYKEEREADLKRRGYRSHINRKGQRNKPLCQRQQKANRTRSKVRSRVEHVFGGQSQMGKCVRGIGQVRAAARIGMMNLVYNMRRFVYLQGISAS